MKFLSLFVIFNFLFLNSVLSKELNGFPKIIDGDTIYINSSKIRLEGIDAPEIKQKCKKYYLNINYIISLNFEREYFCGVKAKNVLKKKIGNIQVKCISLSKDRYKRYLATCFAGKINLNKWIVKSGHAVAYRRYSKIYIEYEDFAKENTLGIWAGSFMMPEKWRKLN